MAIEGKSNVCLEIQVESNTKKLIMKKKKKKKLIMPFSKLIRERNVKKRKLNLC